MQKSVIIPVRFPADHWIHGEANRSEYIRQAVEEKGRLEQIEEKLERIEAMLQNGYAPAPAAPPSEPETDTETKTGEKKVKTDSVLKSSISDFMDF